MASSVAIKKLVSSNLIPSSLRLIRPSAAIQPGSRFFNTNAVRQVDDDSEDDRRIDGPLYGRGADFLSDVVNPFWPTRSLSQMLNVMDQVMHNPFTSASGGIGARRNWDARETEDALNLRIDMPGLDKEHVKVSVEQNTLVIKGEGDKESDDEESGRKCSGRIDLPEKMFKTDEIKAEMKNGVLKVIVPKVKEEEKAGVFHVKIE
ncbi:heat shock 22 kDa protein, mitochondrial-like isoform X2 [Euphorbia lathyris]|uniref:heat shock 22 kDa protein, mitochondrial-like isoform X2 n=1 Tax=Euphorbia lathyris TaxID=212925 RepID=UPI0033132A1A